MHKSFSHQPTIDESIIYLKDIVLRFCYKFNKDHGRFPYNKEICDALGIEDSNGWDFSKTIQEGMIVALVLKLKTDYSGDLLLL